MSVLQATGLDCDHNRAGIGVSCRARMLAETETLATLADQWLAKFESALAAGDGALLRSLFHSDSHWRDVLALTWRIRTVSGADGIARALKTNAAAAHPRGFPADPERT